MTLADLVAANPEALLVTCLALASAVAVVTMFMVGRASRVLVAHLTRDLPEPVRCWILGDDRLPREAVVAATPPMAGLLLNSVLLMAFPDETADPGIAAFGVAFGVWSYLFLAAGAVGFVCLVLYQRATDEPLSSEARVAAVEAWEEQMR